MPAFDHQVLPRKQVSMNAGTQRAKQVMELSDFAKFIGNNKIKIKSQTDPTKSYIISRSDNGLVCECSDHQERKSDCKHVKVALELIRKNDASPTAYCLALCVLRSW